MNRFLHISPSVVWGKNKKGQKPPVLQPPTFNLFLLHNPSSMLALLFWRRVGMRSNPENFRFPFSISPLREDKENNKKGQKPPALQPPTFNLFLLHNPSSMLALLFWRRVGMRSNPQPLRFPFSA